jgi:hypothetical protein
MNPTAISFPLQDGDEMVSSNPRSPGEARHATGWSLAVAHHENGGITLLLQPGCAVFTDSDVTSAEPERPEGFRKAAYNPEVACRGIDGTKLELVARHFHVEPSIGVVFEPGAATECGAFRRGGEKPALAVPYVDRVELRGTGPS